jgi:predicted alpha-1,6-mannanase (GH76 family)
VLKGTGGGDGGLFGGIAARYLTQVATALPGDTSEDANTRDTARDLVMTSAQAAWDHRQTVDGLPLFGANWDGAAEFPTSDVAERDLSVQLSGWMLMEAAAKMLAD